MRIAICDDSQAARNEIICHLKQICNENEYSVEEFQSAEELLEVFSESAFDIIFLDVEMKKIDGIDAGIKIREQDSKAIIIFISNHSKYALRAYDCEAFYFIVKPIEANKFKSVVQKAIEKYKLFHQYYIIKNRGQLIKLTINDIYYVEIYRKRLIFHTKAEIYETAGKIKEAIKALAPYGFYQTHQGYLVNMNKIKDFNEFDIILDNDERVMVSIRKKADVLKAYAEHLERNY